MAKIYFGNVVDVVDPEKKYRVRASINGLTNKLSKEELPWYFPFFGIDHIPVVGDTVPIFIFDDDITTGFYNNKIDLEASLFDGTEYENYVEFYNRLGVSFTYKESTGIEFINDVSKIQIEKEKISSFVKDNQIVMDEKRIDLGTDGQATPLGDMTVTSLEKTLNQSNDMFQECLKMFRAIATACTGVPMLSPIKGALSPLIPVADNKFKPIVQQNIQYIHTIQSKKTFIE